MREKLWKKIEKLIANDNEYRLRSAGTTTVDDEYGFEILLVKTGVDRPEPMEEEKPKREPLRCKLNFHKWGIWENIDYMLGDITAPFQVRECALCNKSEVDHLNHD